MQLQFLSFMNDLIHEDTSTLQNFAKFVNSFILILANIDISEHIHNLIRDSSVTPDPRQEKDTSYLSYNQHIE